MISGIPGIEGGGLHTIENKYLDKRNCVSLCPLVQQTDAPNRFCMKVSKKLQYILVN